jgi:hypothetical protein
MNTLEYSPQRTLDYVNMVKKHAKTISDVNEMMRQNNKDLINTLSKHIDSDTTDKLKEMAKNILASVKQNEKYSEDIEGLHVEIDHEKGMVLFRPKKITRVSVIMFPKSKYYGKKRNKMINTYHKY